MKIIQEKGTTELSANIKKYRAPGSVLHWHENYEICQVISPSCRFLIDGKLINAEKGDIIAIKEHTLHKFLVDHDDTLILVIQFPLKILLNADIAILPLKTHISVSEITAVPQLKEKLDSILDLMTDEKKAFSVKENLFLQALSVSLYFLLMRYFASEESDAASSKDRQDFYAIVKWVNQNFKEDINVKTIASALFISGRRAASLFLKYSGASLNAYINTLRIRNANQLLSEGHTVTEAALDSGFQCIRTFNNVYKSYMGATPSEYTKKIVPSPNGR